MLDETEFGAPWNDQFYEVTLDLDGELVTETMVLPGPCDYSMYDLIVKAETAFARGVIMKIEKCD